MSFFKKNDLFDQYTLLYFIGSGGTAEVWKAKDKQEKIKAIKIFAPDKGIDITGRKLFKEEYSNTLSLDHQNILKPEAYGEFQNRPYLVFKLCDFSLMKTINERLLSKMRTQKTPLFNEDEIAEIMLQIGSGLKYLHEHELIHQDIKPDNILITQSPNINYYIGDFGISKKLKRTILNQTKLLQKTKSGLSPDYAAPEQFQNQIIKPSDIFSFGVTLHELVTGFTPMDKSPQEFGKYLLDGGKTPDIELEISSGLKAIMFKCLEKDPTKRPVAEDLINWAAGYKKTKEWPKLTGVGFNPKKAFLIGFGIMAIPLLIFLASMFGSDNFEDQLFDKVFVEKNLSEANELFKNNYGQIKDPEQKKKLESFFLSVKGIRASDSKFYPVQKKSGDWSFIDKEFNFLGDGTFDQVLNFKGKKAIVIKDGKCAFIDTQGNVLSAFKTPPCEY